MIRVKCFIMISFSFMLTGCAALIFFGVGTAAGITGYKYYQGTLTVIYQAPYMETWDATLKAIHEMKFKLVSSDHDITEGKIVARRSNDKKVAISVKYKSSQETEVTIRVGVLGDKEASEAIKEKLRQVLFHK